MSYHIHVLFWPNSPPHVKLAMDFQRAFYDKFNLNSTNCTMTAGDPSPHTKDICPFLTTWGPRGPFLTAEFSFFIPLAHYEKTVAFSTQNRGVLDILVHPNSGCEVEDHTDWALWSGKPWEVNTSIFSCESPGCVPPDDLEY